LHEVKVIPKRQTNTICLKNELCFTICMKLKVFVGRPVFEEVLDSLRQHFEVTDNQADVLFTPEELTRKLQSQAGAITTGTERIDAALLVACPQLKVVANMAVGFNNFDVPAMTAAGVQATNTPDVLTETTADFGFALLMATARRLTESEHFLRAGKWTKWRYDMFAGAEVHGSTLGIMGMGRIGQGIARRAAEQAASQAGRLHRRCLRRRPERSGAGRVRGQQSHGCDVGRDPWLVRARGHQCAGIHRLATGQEQGRPNGEG
jgi:lactate dehydrogenase-like 2-hydroxyacid dehydrogenase